MKLASLFLICLVIACIAAILQVPEEVGTLLFMIALAVLFVCISVEAIKAAWKADKKRKQQNSEIVSTAIINTTTVSKTKSSVKSSVVRGAVGGAVFGPIGAVAGAVTPKKTTVMKDDTVTFAILYANGKRKVETVKVDSIRYYQLAKYLA